MRIYPEDSFERFEFDVIREHIEAYCKNPLSKEKALQLEPSFDQLEPLLEVLQQSAEYKMALETSGGFPAHQFPDLQRELSLLAVTNAVLSEKQVCNIRDVSSTVNQLCQYLDGRKIIYPAICKLFQQVHYTKVVIEKIDKIVDATGIVKSTASKELMHIRQSLYQARKDLDRAFRNQMTRLKKLGYLADTEESVHNGRRVLAVVAERKREVKGLVQGSSETGKTTFIEPLETVDLNNDVFDLEALEKREIIRILRELTAQLQAHLSLIQAYQDILVEMDFIRAKSLLAIDLNAVLPQVVKYPQVDLQEAYHPILLLQNKKTGKKVIPMQSKLDHQKRILVISGPNAGGKSISLKTIGLLQMMLQAGLLVPVKENSVMGIFSQLLADIGDNQSIEYELSTYSSRLKKMDFFMKFSDKRTLFLIDEFGTGTDPELGGALAEVLLEELEKMNAKGVITTHYANIKLAADRLNGTINASMVFDDETLQPLYQLKIGQPGSSYTFVIAEKAGINKDIIQRAKQKVSNDKVSLDIMLIELQKKQQDLQNQLRVSVEKENLAQEAKIRFDDFNQKWKEKLDAKKANQEQVNKQLEAGRKFQLLVNEWEKTKDKKEAIQKLIKVLTGEKKKKIEAQQIKKNQKESQSASLVELKPIVVGSKVRLLNGKQTGIVEEIIDKKVYVTFGLLKTVAGIDKLQLVEP